jgi:hypothetical protein
MLEEALAKKKEALGQGDDVKLRMAERMETQANKVLETAKSDLREAQM